MRVEVIYAASDGVVHRYRLDVPADAECGSVITASGVLQDCPDVDFDAGCGIAIYGRRAGWRTPVADGDRIEIVRALRRDPKDARRSRARIAGKSIR